MSVKAHIGRVLLGLSLLGLGSVAGTWAQDADLKEGKEEVDQGQPGEIIIKSPLIMKEYWKHNKVL